MDVSRGDHVKHQKSLIFITRWSNTIKFLRNLTVLTQLSLFICRPIRMKVQNLIFYTVVYPVEKIRVFFILLST